MSLVIHAPNVHQGGGRALLLPLLKEVGDTPCTLIVDARLQPSPSASGTTSILHVRPTLFGRLAAEWHLRRSAKPGDTVLCFGNLPPLLPSPAHVKVFLQNRYLLRARSLKDFSWRTRCRIQLERCWLRLCLRRARILVQTPSMAQEVRECFGVEAEVVPFLPAVEPGSAEIAPRRFDFVYVASGEPHKNHRALIEAWNILAHEGVRPVLCLTLDPAAEGELLGWIEAQVRLNGLKVENSGRLSASGIARLYAESGALVYPSLFESFGLPLIEAKAMSLPIVAAELDYVRDVAEPAQTFDPASPISIARAIKRHLEIPRQLPAALSPADFIRRVRGTN